MYSYLFIYDLILFILHKALLEENLEALLNDPKSPVKFNTAATRRSACKSLELRIPEPLPKHQLINWNTSKHIYNFRAEDAIRYNIEASRVEATMRQVVSFSSSEVARNTS